MSSSPTASHSNHLINKYNDAAGSTQQYTLSNHQHTDSYGTPPQLPSPQRATLTQPNQPPYNSTQSSTTASISTMPLSSSTPYYTQTQTQTHGQTSSSSAAGYYPTHQGNVQYPYSSSATNPSSATATLMQTNTSQQQQPHMYPSYQPYMYSSPYYTAPHIGMHPQLMNTHIMQQAAAYQLQPSYTYSNTEQAPTQTQSQAQQSHTQIQQPQQSPRDSSSPSAATTEAARISPNQPAYHIHNVQPPPLPQSVTQPQAQPHSQLQSQAQLPSSTAGISSSPVSFPPLPNISLSATGDAIPPSVNNDTLSSASNMNVDVSSTVSSPSNLQQTTSLGDDKHSLSSNASPTPGGDAGTRRNSSVAGNASSSPSPVASSGNVSSKRGHWTPDEDERLSEAVKIYDGRNWKRIAETAFGNRKTDVQCLHRWQKVLRPGLVKGPWTKEEDDMVIQLVSALGLKKWTDIAKHLKGRLGKQCRERWYNHLDPAIKKEPWSPQEDRIIIDAHREFGNKWALIAQRLKGRTDNSIKNRWNSTLQRVISQNLPLTAIDYSDTQYVKQEKEEQKEDNKPREVEIDENRSTLLAAAAANRAESQDSEQLRSADNNNNNKRKFDGSDDGKENNEQQQSEEQRTTHGVTPKPGKRRFLLGKQARKLRTTALEKISSSTASSPLNATLPTMSITPSHGTSSSQFMIQPVTMSGASTPMSMMTAAKIEESVSPFRSKMKTTVLHPSGSNKSHSTHTSLLIYTHTDKKHGSAPMKIAPDYLTTFVPLDPAEAAVTPVGQRLNEQKPLEIGENMPFSDPHAKTPSSRNNRHSTGLTSPPRSLNRELDEAAEREGYEMKTENGGKQPTHSKENVDTSNSSPTNTIHHLADIASSQPATPLKAQHVDGRADTTNISSSTNTGGSVGTIPSNNVMSGMTTFISPLRRLITPRSDVIRPQTLVKLPPISELSNDKVMMYDTVNYASRDPLFADAERILQAAQTASSTLL